jgi:hypothetical protein
MGKQDLKPQADLRQQEIKDSQEAQGIDDHPFCRPLILCR